jgi:hypothetical protein
MLFARINPFEPVITPKNTIIVKPKYFKKAEVYLPNDARVLKKIIFVYQNASSDIKQKEVEINKDIDFHSPIIITHNPNPIKMKKVRISKFLTIFIKDKKIFLKTKDKLIRHFFLIKPFRIVLDFKRYSSFPTIVKKISDKFLTKVVVGAHRKYYRVVLYFDSNYNYKIFKTDEGIKIVCW